MSSASSSELRRLVVGPAGILLVGALLAVAIPTLALAVAPAFLLFLLFASGRMPGEKLVLRLRTARPAARRRPVRLSAPALAIVVRPVGRLLAAALAVRPPPARRLLIS